MSHFEHLTSFEHSVGIFYLYDSDEEHCLSGYVRLYDLINVVYNGILNFALEGEKHKEFNENWISYVDERGYPDGLMSSVFRLEIIEKFLEFDNRYEARRKFTKD